MRVLILKPGRGTLDYAYMRNGQNCPLLSARVYDNEEAESDRESLRDALLEVRQAIWEAETYPEPEAIAVRVLFGGSLFRAPAVAAPDVLRGLEELVPHAPLHLPLVLALTQECGEVFPGVPVVLVFETAFFAELPAREHLYGLSADLLKSMGLRRYGFNGIFHQAAVQSVVRQRAKRGLSSPARILSLCLDPQPEVAAMIGSRPLMVTSGVTPLEGIPGQTTSGEVDPTIVLTLAQTLGWGPERINMLLTQESGILGLAGRAATLETVLRANDSGLRLAKEVLQYRMLLACGSGIAAMGGLDVIVFSGRFAAAGEVVGPWLTSKLKSITTLRNNQVTCDCFYESLDRIIADTASAEILARMATVER